MTTFHVLMLIITAFWVPIASGLLKWLWSMEDRLNNFESRLKVIENERLGKAQVLNH